MHYDNVDNDCIEAAERIRGLRKDRGFTQEEMAVELDISASSLQKIEEARRNCSMKTLIKMVSYFGVSADYILFGDEPEQKE